MVMVLTMTMTMIVAVILGEMEKDGEEVEENGRRRFLFEILETCCCSIHITVLSIWCCLCAITMNVGQRKQKCGGGGGGDVGDIGVQSDAIRTTIGRCLRIQDCFFWYFKETAIFG